MKYLAGRPFPLGSRLTEINGEKGVNFALFSRRASGVELSIFCEGKEIRLPMIKTDEIWHLFVVGLPVGTQYGYRVTGVVNEEKGDLFNPNKLLVDPYANAIIGHPDLSSDEAVRWFQWNDSRDNAHLAPKSVVVERHTFDWEGDYKPFTPWAETVVYETHVKGFSKLNKEIPEELRGTFAGLAHEASISHLKRLGITAIELLPITYHVDEPHLQKMGLTNYWGYNVLGHFAVDPKLAYDKADPLTEFKQLVKTLHKAGIEVIMDVVFNHTAEAGKDGPTLSQRGIDNEAYYWLTDNSEYLNWTGCGNTLNVSSDVAVLRWVIDCLCYWVKECNVDGFRFDLGAVLGRAPTFSEKSAFFTAVYSNSKLAHIKLIAEPWDIGWSGYQLGAFPKPFAEWNDRFRDDMRRFFLEKNGNLAGFVRRFAGSDDIFAHNRQPFHSINFITAHDGFTLQDLVSYNEKHNWANGEQNRDGHGHNISFNFGVEGKTDNPIILKQRKQAKKALLTTLLLSGGTPMLLAGDELGHSQQGNNNSYCQDNEISWIDWDSADQELIDYTAKLIAIRKQIPLLSQDTKWWTGEDVQWLRADGQVIQFKDWHDHFTKALQILLEDKWLILVNAKQAMQQFLLPKGDWQILLGEKETTLMTDTLAVTLNDIEVCVLQRN
ncbi:glycogen debranching protein GlgX [Actinobacillus indolicus]|uniref:Glycogen debranching protein GlgX n=1 Tax=Actinobacillus indolicus TaxID=51049 RepID=A0A4P7CHT7_9PAST|nr:glycogen debranching protein GlgX [Actinobacillus indolicus]QBQ64663.1 glycogen debranching protein GlgX [Actinobacillus indolicus]